jgi:hypothetical protein
VVQGYEELVAARLRESTSLVGFLEELRNLLEQITLRRGGFL